MRSAGPSRRRRVRAILLALPVVALPGFLLAPERHLACDETWLKERSPDHAWTLTVCRRPMIFAMPGGGTDAPGWIVLRDANEAIRGVVHLEMLQLDGDGRPDCPIIASLETGANVPPCHPGASQGAMPPPAPRRKAVAGR